MREAQPQHEERRSFAEYLPRPPRKPSAFDGPQKNRLRINRSALDISARIEPAVFAGIPTLSRCAKATQADGIFKGAFNLS